MHRYGVNQIVNITRHFELSSGSPYPFEIECFDIGNRQPLFCCLSTVT